MTAEGAAGEERLRAPAEETGGEARRAADDARAAAEKARELADLLDDYASCLLEPELQARASELHMVAGGKLRAIRETLAGSDDLIERSGRSV